MSLEDLRKQFIVDDATVKKDLESLVSRALAHALVDTKGRVHLRNQKLSGIVKVKLALSARTIASQLEASFKPTMTVEEVVEAAGLPPNQARARLSQAVEERFAETPERGAYRANPHRIAAFLDDLEREKGNAG